MFKRFLILSLFLIAISVPAQAPRWFNHTDPMWEWEIDENNNTTWISYASVQAYAAAHNIPYNPSRPQDVTAYNTQNVVLFYHIFNQITNLVDPRIIFSIDDTNVMWNWYLYPHAHIDTYDISDYSDILYLLEDYDYINSAADATDPNLIAFNSRLQTYINNARIARWIDPFPTGTEPLAWSPFFGVAGGQWLRHGGDFWVARIDIDATRNGTEPQNSAAYRIHNQPRYRPSYDENDLSINRTIGTDVFINYASHTIELYLPNAVLTLLNVPRHSPISIEVPDDQRWYVGHISHRDFNQQTGAITFITDPHSKKGSFTAGTIVTVKIKQED